MHHVTTLTPVGILCGLFSALSALQKQHKDLTEFNYAEPDLKDT